MADERTPVLWHISFSHYNEKVRWALDYKEVGHERRQAFGGTHPFVALALTRGRSKTFPLLGLDGEHIGDSTAIIAELERRWPDPPLYPEDATERRRALELEDWFDEELGPHLRLLVFHELTRDRERIGTLAATQVPEPLSRAPAVGAAMMRTFVNLRFGVHKEERAELAQRKVLAALDRLEAELGDADYLVGDRFSVADLTAASLLYPLALPPEGPQLGIDMPEAIERFRRPLKERRGYRWVEQMFRRHRLAAPAPAGTPA
ncbi:MAG: glutathione S-transferase family protein [Thermoleophilaceae bacterium]